MIPGDVGLCSYVFDKQFHWYRVGDPVVPVVGYDIHWNKDVIFTTPNGTAIQMKVVDTRGAPEVVTSQPPPKRTRTTPDGGQEQAFVSGDTLASMSSLLDLLQQ